MLFGFSRSDPVRLNLELVDRRLSWKENLLQGLLYGSPLFLSAAAMILGIVMRYTLHLAACYWTGIGICLVLLLLVMHRLDMIDSFPLRIFLMCISFMAFGAVRLDVFYRSNPDDIKHLVNDRRMLATIEGTILTEVQNSSPDSWAFGRYSWSSDSSSFYLRARKIQTYKGWSNVSGRIRVQVSDALTGINAGDSVRIYCWLSRFDPPLNPGQFNMQTYMNRRGIFLSASVPTAGGVVLLDRNSSFFHKYRTRIQSAVSMALLDELDPDQQSKAIIQALLLGRRKNMDQDVFEAFRKTGLAHFICLSGMHMAILSMFVWRICRFAGLSKRWRAVVTIILTAVYVAVVPPRAATLRAAVICWFFCVSVIVQRRGNPLNTLSFAAIVLLAYRPMDIFNAGWQLSYMTVLGILFFYPAVYQLACSFTLDRLVVVYQKKMDDRRYYYPLLFMERVIQLASVGVSAWLGGVGVLIYHFGTVSPFASIWTVLVYPLVFAIMATGVLKVILILVLPTAGMLMGFVLFWFSNLFIMIVQWMGRVPFSQISVGQKGLVYVLVLYASLLIVNFFPLSYQKLRRNIIYLCLIVTIGPIVFDRLMMRTSDNINLTVLSVGHGQAIYINLPGGRNVLFDCGSLSMQDCGRKAIVPFLRSIGVSHLDAVILSHDDIDHINGLPEVCSLIRVDKVFANEAFINKSQTLSTAGYLRGKLAAEGIVINDIETLDKDLFDELQFLWPPDDWMTAPSVSDNDKSLVLMLENHGRKLLICSDIEKTAQEKLLSNHPGLNADILVMPHHGSTINLSENFIKKLSPDFAVISCSRTRLESAWKPVNNIRTYYTPANGAVAITLKQNGRMLIKPFISSSKR